MSGNDLVARNVRRFRIERSLSLGELGRVSGLSKQTLSQLELGNGNPTVETLELVSRALGVSIRALLTELGSEVRTDRRFDASWTKVGEAEVRALDQIYGSGYVSTSILRLRHDSGAVVREPRGRGSLALVYVILGSVRLGPQNALVDVEEGDFARFPAELPYHFVCLSDAATLHVTTTALQLLRDDGAVGAPSAL